MRGESNQRLYPTHQMEISSLGSPPRRTGSLNSERPHSQGLPDAPENVKPNMLHGQLTTVGGPNWTFPQTTRLNPSSTTTSNFTAPPWDPNNCSHPNLWRQLSHAPPRHLPPTPHHHPLRPSHTIRKRSHWNHNHLYTSHRHLHQHTPSHCHQHGHMPHNSSLSRTPQHQRRYSITQPGSPSAYIF